MVKKITGYLALPEEAKNGYFKEEFKGEVFDKPVNFPKELGAEHPFDFKYVEDVYKKVGLVASGVNKITDSIVGDFTVKVENENAQTILDGFIKDTNFTTKLRPWIREGVLKGNGFMELDLKNSKIRVMNANNMYVKRNKKSLVLGYNQFVGDLNRFSKESKDFINFTPSQIAHLKINKIPNEAYGCGGVYHNIKVLDNMLGSELDYHKLIKRKAGAPIHIKVGQPGQSVQASDIDDFSNKLKFMNTRTEWVTDANTEMNILNFGDLGTSLTESIRHDFMMLVAGFEIPEVLWGSGQLNEGIAKVQLDGYQRKIQSMREEIEVIVANDILKPVLNANGFDETIKFEWNLPSEEEINKRIEQIQSLLNTFGISENMKRLLQLELAKLFGFENADEVLLKPKAGVDEEVDEIEKELKKQPLEKDVEKKPSESAEAKKEGKIKQPEVPGVKPNAKAKQHNHIQETENMNVREYINLIEIAGFNYSDYLVKILQLLKIEKFSDLAAKNAKEIADGLLNAKEIKKLRIIMRDGFRKNKTMDEIERDVKGLNLRDRVTATSTITASARPNMIARTETVRMANKGLVEVFKDNKIEEVRWLAALSDRTCPLCENLNGQIFPINNLAIGETQPPLHVGCRCSLISVI